VACRCSILPGRALGCGERLSDRRCSWFSCAAALLVPSDDDRAITHLSFQTVSRFWDIGTLPGGSSMHPRGDEYSYFRGDGTLHWLELIVAREDDEDGKPLRVVGTCIDITERKEATERIALSARSDALTGLANRMLLNERLSAACSAAKRRKSAMSILFIDLDGFKETNDTLGHSVGEALLQSVAARLRNLTRAEDEVGRNGGEEFVILGGGSQ